MLRFLLPLALVTAPLAAQDAALAAAPGAWLAARDLARGTVLADSDAVAPAGTPPHAARPTGHTTRRLLRAGEALREPAVAPPVAVSRGDAVALVLRSGTLTLTLRGTALGDAALGRRVLVRVDTKRRFEGTVSAPGVVEIEQ